MSIGFYPTFVVNFPQPKQVLFVVGAPRSGSTLLLDFLTAHPQTSWICEDLDTHPGELKRAARIRRFDWPLLGEFWFERRYAWEKLPSPAENSGFWDHWLPGFSHTDTEPHPPRPDEVREEDVVKAREALAELCAYQRRSFFVGQCTGFPRVALLRRVFPQARFIQSLRDPRSIAFWMAKQFNKNPENPLWVNREVWKKAMPEALSARLDTLELTPLNFSGVLIRWYHQCLRAELQELPGSDRLEVGYSDLLSKPEETLKRVFRFAGLPHCKRLDTYLKYHSIHGKNQRSRKEMTQIESDQLEQAVAG